MNQWVRIYELHRRLSQNEYPNARSLAIEYGVSKRTIELDCAKLREMGADVGYKHKYRGWYYIDPTFTLPAVRLTEGELLAFFLSVEIARSSGNAGFTESLQNAVAKIAGNLGEFVSVDLNALSAATSYSFSPAARVDAVTYQEFHRAGASRQKVRMRYYTASRGEWNSRVVHPYHLRFVRGDWLLIAFDENKNDVLCFNIARVSQLDSLDEHFLVRSDFDAQEYVRTMFFAERGQQTFDIVVRFDEYHYAKNDSKKPEHASVLLFLSKVEFEEAAKCIADNWEELKSFAEARRKKIAEIEAKKAPKKKAGEAPVEAGAESSDETVGEATGDGKFKDLPKPKADKAIVERLKNAALSSDIALFGRMLAEHSEHRIEAAAQVAHAISTHAVTPELDFFSAVDDLNKDDAGAGMLGVTGFNAAVFYRYALLDFDALLDNLQGDQEVAFQTARAFLTAFVNAIPSGKQNSMAAQSLPSLGLFVVRESGSPCSLVNAFCEPISLKNTKDTGGYLDGSVDKFAKYWGRYEKVYGSRGITEKALFCLESEENLGALSSADKGSVHDAIDAAMKALGENTGEA